VSRAKESAAGAAMVAVMAIAVWLVPGLSNFLLFPPVLLGVGVGLVARYCGARSSILVLAAMVTTAIIFGVFIVRVSSYGVHGESLGIALAMGALVVTEATLAAAAGATLGRMRRHRDAAAVRST
jgi:hypothetical protein